MNPGFEFLCDEPGTSVDGYLNTGYISCMEDDGALDLGTCSGPAHYGCPSPGNACTEQDGGGGVKRTETSRFMVFCALASCLSLVVTSFS